MSHETHVTETTLDPRMVLVMQRNGCTRITMPVGGMRAECLVLLYAGVRTALGASAVGERVAVAVPDENITDLIESLIAAARQLFPDRVRGLRLEWGGSDRAGVSGRGGPWITVTQCAVAALDGDGAVTHACCPSMICKDMVALVDGVMAEHDSNPALGGGGRCGWSGVGVVDDRAEYLPPGEPAPGIVRAGERP